MSSSAAAARSSESTLQLPNATLLGAEAKGKGTAYHVVRQAGCLHNLALAAPAKSLSRALCSP